MKKLLSVILAVMMVMTLVPMSVFSNEATLEGEIAGDLDHNGDVDANDAILLLQHSLFPELYPIEYSGNLDFSGDGYIEAKDAIYLLRHSMFPDLYPIEGDVFVVSFDLNCNDGENAPKDQRVGAGGYAAIPKSPERDGYAFAGWYEDDTYSEVFDFSNEITESVTVYARWIDIEDPTDTDGDGLTDPMEEYYGTDITMIDTDEDELTDYDEIALFGTDPLDSDSDGDGILDSEEDYDEDGIDNLTELLDGTDPVAADTDMDGLNDYEEYEYSTDPIFEDTDEDGVTDGKEVELGTDPLEAEESFSIEVSAEEDEDGGATPSVQIELSGEQVETLVVEPVINETFFPETMPGYMGKAYDFSVDGEFETATISFEFDPDAYESSIDPVIYYFNEEEQLLEELETTVEGNVAYAEVTHFSTYVLVDRTVYQESFTWEDDWEESGAYTSAEVVLVIDDSGSLRGTYGNDPQNKRLEAARVFVDNLNENIKVGIVKFDSTSSKVTADLVECNDDGKEELKSYLQIGSIFDSSGNTAMYAGINTGYSYYSDPAEEPDVLRAMLLFTDGENNMSPSSWSNIKSTAISNGIKIYPVGLGGYDEAVLNEIAKDTDTGDPGKTDDAEDLAKLFNDVREAININLDSDTDGVPDYYEDNMIIFNGVSLALDKYNSDSDGDGLLDGEEVEITKIYNEDGTKVKVIGKLVLGDPTDKDTDKDGFTDSEDPTPLKPIYFKNFDYYKNYRYKDKAMVTIFVDQPYKNSREVINYDDEDEYFGHTYIGIDYDSGEEYAGFWPLKGYGTKNTLMLATVDGKIMMIDEAYKTYGDKNEYESISYNEKDHKWDIACSFNIPKKDIGKIKEYAENYTERYNMVSNNCTTFAVDVLKYLGINPKIYSHKWSHENSLGSYEGYTPADAGQDIRENYNRYAISTTTTLKDKTVTDAVIEAYRNK